MSLESIVKVYGWNDYLDMNTGRIYQLSKATDDKCGGLRVPVVQMGVVIGYAKMKKEV